MDSETDQPGVKPLNKKEKLAVIGAVLDIRTPSEKSPSASKSSLGDKSAFQRETRSFNKKTSRFRTRGSQEEWIKPFELGWRREIVQRSTCTDTSGAGKGPLSDVYYFSPEGRKMRSCREIDSYLTKTESPLRVSCFTFVKEPIYKEPSEITRSAGQSKRHVDRSTEQTSGNPEVSSRPRVISSKLLRSASIASPVTPSRSLAGSSKSISSPNQSSCLQAISLKSETVTNKMEMSKEAEAVIQLRSITFETEPASPLTALLDPKTRKHKQQENSTKRQRIEEIPLQNTEMNDIGQHLCNMSCCGQQKYLPPSLPCQACHEMKLCDETKPTSGEATTATRERSKHFRYAVWQKAFYDVKKFHVGYDSLLQIFHNLAIPDLLRVREVCKTWKEIASHSALWRVVRLNGCLVKNWEEAIKWMRLRGTWTLDLCQVKNLETTQEFLDAVEYLPSLSCIELAPCTGWVAQSVAGRLKHLKSFSAEGLRDNRESLCCKEIQRQDRVRLNMKVFSEMKSLEVLRLRAFSRIIPEHITQLTELVNLKVLSLTSLHSVPGKDLTFIAFLKNIKILQLGECCSWEKEVFQVFSKLPKLNTLRLEGREAEQDPGLGEALLKMNKLSHLELIRYVVGEDLSKVLPKVTQLKIFTIWPEMLEDMMKNARCNTHILSAVSKMDFLDKLIWSVTFPVISLQNTQPFTIPILSKNSGNGLELDEIKLSSVQSHLSHNLPYTQTHIFNVPLIESNSYKSIATSLQTCS